MGRVERNAHLRGEDKKLSRTKRNSYLDIDSSLDIAIGKRSEKDLPEEVKEEELKRPARYTNFNTFIKEASEKQKISEEEIARKEKEEKFNYLEKLNEKYFDEIAEEKENSDLFSDILDDEKSKNNKVTPLAKTIKVIDDNKVSEEGGKLVNSFYTRSMDLSKNDFDFDNEDYDGKKEGSNTFLIVLIIFMIIAIVLLILYYLGKLDFIKDIKWKK